MANVFLFGTLCWPLLLNQVAGKTCPKAQAAVLEGFKVSRAKSQNFPMIQKVASEKTEGILLQNCDETVVSRLDHYESGFGYHLHPVKLWVNHEEINAKVYLPPDSVEAGGHWDLKKWAKQHGELILEAAVEVMALQGVKSASEMADCYPMMLVRADARINARKKPSPPSSSTLALEDVDLHSRSQPYTKFFAVNEAVVSIPKFSGGKMENLTRAGFVGSDAAIILPYDPKTDRVLLIEQFRFGPFLREDANPWILEPIAGRIDAGEAPEKAACREAMEEAGLAIYDVHRVHSGYVSPGISTEYFHVFIGLADIKEDSAILGGLSSESEDIKGHVITFKDFFSMLQQGKLPVSPLALAGYWLASNRSKLRNNS